MYFDIAEVAAHFPKFRLAVIVCRDFQVLPARSAALADFVAGCEQKARQRWSGMELSAVPGIAAWRQAYRQFGIKKTSYRSSVERLVKNVLAGGGIPAINGFVDAYNAISLKHVLPAGADDLDQVRGSLAFRYARGGDIFYDMGALNEAGEPPADPPKAGEVVYADEEKVLCRRWNWRQDARSVIRPDTRRAVVTLQGNGEGNVAAAADELVALFIQECGGRCTATFLDAERQHAELAEPG